MLKIPAATWIKTLAVNGKRNNRVINLVLQIQIYRESLHMLMQRRIKKAKRIFTIEMYI